MSLSIVVLIAVIIIGLYFLMSTGNHNTISSEEFKQKYATDQGTIIDVRNRQEYSGGHLKEADYNWDYTSGEFKQKLDQLDKDKTYYLHCRSGNRSGKAAKLMKQRGFEHVYNIGGYQDLVNAGFEPEN